MSSVFSLIIRQGPLENVTIGHNTKILVSKEKTCLLNIIKDFIPCSWYTNIIYIQYFWYKEIGLVVRETNPNCFDAGIWSHYNNFMIPIIQYIEFRFIFIVRYNSMEEFLRLLWLKKIQISILATFLKFW